MVVKSGRYLRDFPPISLCARAVLSMFSVCSFWLLVVRREVISLKCMRLERELELKVAVFVQDDDAPALSPDSSNPATSASRLTGTAGS